MIKIILILNFLALSAFCEVSDSLENQELAKTINQISYEPNWFALFLGLFTVIFLIYLTGFLYQKMIKINLSNKEIQDGKIDVLSTTSIGQGRNLHVVKVGNQNILIGATQNSITYIADVKSEKVQGENYDAKNS